MNLEQISQQVKSVEDSAANVEAVSLDQSNPEKPDITPELFVETIDKARQQLQLAFNTLNDQFARIQESVTGSDPETTDQIITLNRRLKAVKEQLDQYNDTSSTDATLESLLGSSETSPESLLADFQGYIAGIDIEKIDDADELSRISEELIDRFFNLQHDVVEHYAEDSADGNFSPEVRQKIKEIEDKTRLQYDNLSSKVTAKIQQLKGLDETGAPREIGAENSDIQVGNLEGQENNSSGIAELPLASNENNLIQELTLAEIGDELRKEIDSSKETYNNILNIVNFKDIIIAYINYKNTKDQFETVLKKHFGENFSIGRFGEYELNREQLRGDVVEIVKLDQIVSKMSDTRAFLYDQLHKKLSHRLKDFSVFDDLIEKYGSEMVVEIFTQIRITDITINYLPQIIEIFFENNVDYSEAQKNLFIKLIDIDLKEIDRLMELAFLDIDHDKIYSEIDSVIDIFTKNALPLCAKKFKLYELLSKGASGSYSSEINYSRVAGRSISNVVDRYLNQSHVVDYILYGDLLRSSVESGSQDLKQYLENLQKLQATYDKYVNGQDVDENELRQFQTYLSRITGSEVQVADGEDIFKKFEDSIGMKPDQSISDRIAEIYLRPLGVNSVSEALQKFDEVAQIKTLESKDLVSSLTENSGKMVEVGDLVKGFDPDNLGYISEEGFVCAEFLGATSKRDHYAPLVSDVMRVSDEIFKASESYSNRFGSVMAVIKNVDQKFTGSTEFTPQPSSLAEPELCHVGTDDDKENHFGVRGGISLSMVDAFIIQEKVRDRHMSGLIAMQLTKGMHIPIFDDNENLLFSPEQFDQMRAEFSGTKWSDEPQVVAEDLLSAGSLSKEQLEGLERVERLRDEVVNNLRSFFEVAGVQFSQPFNARDLTVAEIDDTGSTGRGTSLPNDFDFDISIRLGQEDYKKVQEFINQITAGTNGVDNGGGDRSGSYQFRKSGVTELLGQTFTEAFDLDINFKRKEVIPLYESHDAVADRLQSVEDGFGESGKEMRQKVVGQILKAKKVLREAGVYKKGDFNDGEGGLGGIGVENWVLTKGQGSFTKAAESFIAEAIDEAGQVRSFEDFKSRYMVIDAGANILAKSGSSPHDNFIAKNMTAKGYEKMVTTLQNYLGQSL